MNYAEMLSQFALFTGIPKNDISLISMLCLEVACKQGEILFREGQPATNLYLLLEGSISLQIQLTSRPELINVAKINQWGQSCGWSSLVAPNHYTATASCDTDARLLGIDGPAFLHYMEGNPAVGFRLLLRIAGIISNRLRNSRVALLKAL
jgi:toluene monooxygenase system ferredoxin subunit